MNEYLPFSVVFEEGDRDVVLEKLRHFLANNQFNQIPAIKNVYPFLHISEIKNEARGVYEPRFTHIILVPAEVFIRIYVVSDEPGVENLIDLMKNL